MQFFKSFLTIFYYYFQLFFLLFLIIFYYFMTQYPLLNNLNLKYLLYKIFICDIPRVHHARTTQHYYHMKDHISEFFTSMVP